jgi:hypothetical protein
MLFLVLNSLLTLLLVLFLNGFSTRTLCKKMKKSCKIECISNILFPMISPNMTNDGHDTTAEFAGNWLTNFFNTTLSNQTFVSETLILITFDENETYSKANRVWSVLLGAIPASSKNTTDGTFYTHYSTLSTVEQNWGLGNLGRGDANTTLANVYSFVASQIGYTNVNIANGSSVSLFNATIPGLLTNQSYNETHPSASGSGAGATATHGSGAARLTTSAVIVSIAGAVAAALML